MTEMIRDTAFGHILRLVTGGRVLQYEEDKDPSVWKRYIDKEKSGRMAHHGTVEEEKKEEEGKKTGNEDAGEDQQPDRQQGSHGAQASRNSSNTQLGDETPRNEVSGVPIDSEKGRDASIVTWFSDEDPEVSFFVDTHLGLLIDCIESHELVNGEEVPCDILDMFPDLLGLHRICHLLSWYPRRHAEIRCLPSRRHTRSHSLRRWLWSWPYDLGTNVRDPTDRTESCLHRHPLCLRFLPVRRHIRHQFWHALGLPILDWFLRFSCLSNRWRITLRYVQAS